MYDVTSLYLIHFWQALYFDRRLFDNSKAVATRRVPNIQFHSFHVRKSYANPVTEPKSNPNTNVTVVLNLFTLLTL